MASLNNPALFFTTSPRTPSHMIPEIRLLDEKFSGQVWNRKTQEQYTDELNESIFFRGKGSKRYKSFSARDRINRSPKALGFVDLKPCVTLTEAGRAFIYGKRPQEIFLRQLLKFQLPSPYHVETSKTKGKFWVRPFLEVLRLIRELGYITFDEFKIFVVQMTDYRRAEEIKGQIIAFREARIGSIKGYKTWVNSIWTEAVLEIYEDDIQRGKIKTRETSDYSLKKFVSTKKRNFRDYADACFRYLRYTGLVSLSNNNRSIAIYEDRVQDVDRILSTVDREPVFVRDEKAYKAYLFDPAIPILPYDDKESIIDHIMRVDGRTRRELIGMTLEELKDVRDDVIERHKSAVISAQVDQLKSYALYSEIIDTYHELITTGYYDAPLMLEYNTWRAMTMLDGGSIKGNFKFDDAGQPLSTAPGNMADIECDYGDFAVSVEVTLRSGQRQFEAEGEPVARHYGQLRRATQKDVYCLFIARTVNAATMAHFFTLNRTSVVYYGGKSKIVPLELDQFMRLIDNSYNSSVQPQPENVRAFLDTVVEQCETSKDEDEWKEKIQRCVEGWLAA